MSFESNETVIAGTGHIWAGTVGTAFPTNISTAIDETLWAELGLTVEDGVHVTFDRQSKDFGAWQVRDTIRTIITAEPKKVDFMLRQWNQNTWILASGGGAFSGSDPNYVYTPPAAGYVDERAGIVQWTDGDKNYRLLIPKWINKAPLDFTARADDMANLPISMSLLLADGQTRAYTMQTDDDNLGLAASAGS